MIDKINGAAFKEMVLFGAACIAGQKQAINDIKSYELVLRDAVNVNRFYGSAHTCNGKTFESKRAD